MAKQKVVIEVTMKDAKKRTKALKIAAGFSGVVSAEVKDSTVTVVGDRIDTIALTVKLRKQMGFAELSKVGAYDEMKEKEEKMRKDMAKQMSSPAYMYSPYPYSPYPHAYPVHDAYNNHHNDPSCSIM